MGAELRRPRHAVGRWYTPPAVADLALALALPRPVAGMRVLDPACGDGVFLARAAAAGIPASALAGIEVEPDAAAAAAGRVPGARIRCADLFALAPETGAGGAGYDAVVGNPPYVRQERLPAGAKRRVRARLVADWPEWPAREIDRIAGRGDLAAACIARAVRLARPGGRIALVVSSALLDADYARPLWRLVVAEARVLAIVDAPAERWFDDAAVNAVIILLERRRDDDVAPAGERVAIARLATATAAAAAAVRGPADLVRVASVREAPADLPERWAAALRAAPVWFELEAAAGEALVPLGELAEVRRGLTTGANDVFYIARRRAAELRLEPALLRPLVRAPDRRAPTIAIDPARSSHLVLVCPPGTALARYPAIARYLAGHAARASGATLRAREPWWALPAKPARLFLTKAYASRYVQRIAPAPLVADQRVYSLHLRAAGASAAAVDEELVAAVLNSTFTAFALESLGRASMGEGALEWTVADAAALPVIDPRRLDAAPAAAARAALAATAHRPIGTVADEREKGDRRRLDVAVAAAAPAAAPLLGRIHDALAASVAARAARARGAGRSR